MPQTVLVTGGAGFIGSHVVDAYLAAGYEVTVVDDLSSGRRENVPERARFLQADIRSAEARELLAAGGFAILNHQAAQIDVRYSVAHPAVDASVNVVGLLNLLEGARAGNLQRVVFASSGGTVYGPAARIPTPEGAPKLPASPYGAAKLAAEYYLTIFAQLHGLETVALRYSNVYGPRQDSHGEAGVVAIFAGKLLAGDPLIVFGDGEQTRDMVYVGDVAAANIAASRCNPPLVEDLDGRSYNIATGVETSVNKLAALLSDVVGRTPEVRHAPERAGEIRRSALAIEKAARELDWQPKTSLIDGLRATVRWLREQ